MEFSKIYKHKNYILYKSVSQPIYKITTDNLFDLGMLFLRHQEFYESEKFKNKHFTILEYMRWYVLENDSLQSQFAYCDDWCGYNIPSTTLKKSIIDIPDPNIYDDIFNIFYNKILELTPDKFYLVGCLSDDEDTMLHEIAHSLFFLNKEYKNEMLSAIDGMSKKERHGIETFLKDGYAKKVFNDEIQAYVSTGIPVELINVVKDNTINKFQKIFFRYYNDEGI